MGSFADAVSSTGAGSTTSRSQRARAAAKEPKVQVDGQAISAKKFTQGIARLRVSGGDGQKIADQLLSKYGPDIPEETLSAAGLSVPKPKHESFFDKAKRVGGGALMSGLEFIGRPGQATLEGLQAVGQSAGLGFAPYGGGGYGDIVDALRGKQDHTLNLREATGRDPNSGGRLAGFVDTIGTIALDPTTYITAGTGGLAEQGLKAAGEEAAAGIAKSGLRNTLDEAGQAVLRTKLIESEAGQLAKKGAENYADETMTALARGGRGGVKFAGFTVVPGETIRGARAAVLSDEGALAARRVAGAPSRALSKGIEKVAEPIAAGLRKAFVPRADIIDTYGKETADLMHDALGQSTASGTLLTQDVVDRLGPLTKAAKPTDDEKARMLKALDVGGSVPAEIAAFQAEGRDDLAKLLENMDSIRHEAAASDVAAGLARPGEELTGVRQAAYEKAQARLSDEAAKPLTEKQAAAQSAREAATAAEEAHATLKLQQSDALQGAGRSTSFGEGRKIGTMEERAARAESEAVRLGKLVKAGEEAAPGVREAAYRSAVDDAMSQLPRAQKGAESARSLAERTNDDLAHYQDMLHDKIAAGEKVSAKNMRKLGNLEGRAKVAEDAAKAAERGQEGAFAAANRKLAGASKTADKHADITPLTERAQQARLSADKAHAAAYEARRAAEDRAALANGEASFGMGKQLGSAGEKARSALREAKRREEILARAETRTEKALQESVPKKAAKEAEKAVRKAANKNVYLKNVDDYVLRELTPEGRKALEEAGGELGAAAARFSGTTTGRAFGEGGSLGHHRALLPDKSIMDANKELAERLGKDDGFKVFETDPTKLTAARAARSYRAAAEVQYVSDLSKIADGAGNPLVLVGKDAEKEAKKLGYTTVTSKHLGGVWAAPDVAKEIDRVNAVVFNDEALKSWEKTVDKWGSLWAGYATTPVIFGTGFFARNAMGNVFNNVLAGVKTTAYAKAFSVQRAVSKAIEETGRSVGPEFEAALVKSLGERDAKILLTARDHGVLSTGFFSGDLGDPALEQLAGGGKLSKLNPLNKHNILLAPGAKLNEAIENNARLAHFISKVDELGDPVAASRSVKKYLFDYSDLTPFEKNKMRRFVRFYTYMRKNTPLQFAELAHQPGKFAALAHAEQGLGGEAPSGPLPNYALQGGAIPIGGKLIGTDTPFSSALRTVQPALQALTLVPGLGALLPAGLKPEHGFEDVTRGVLNTTSGGPVEIVKSAFEQTLGKDLFTGARNKRGAKATITRFADALLPLYSKGKTTVRNVGDLDGRDQARVRLMTTLLGLQVAVVDPQAQAGEQYRQAQLVDEAIQRLSDEGVDVPTSQQLQDAGIVPPPPKTKGTKSKARTPAQRRRDALLALQTAGADTSEAGTYNAPSKTRRGR